MLFPASDLYPWKAFLLYYVGYGAVLVDDKGMHSPLRGELGSMVCVFSDGTMLQSVSNYVSLFLT